MLQILQVAPVTEINIKEAIDFSWSDLEDALQFSVGKSIKAEYIITRDVNGFITGDSPIIATPSSFLTDYLSRIDEI